MDDHPYTLDTRGCLRMIIHGIRGALKAYLLHLLVHLVTLLIFLILSSSSFLSHPDPPPPPPPPPPPHRLPFAVLSTSPKHNNTS